MVVLAATEGAEVSTFIFMRTWVPLVASEIPADADDPVIGGRRLWSLYLDHTALLSDLNLTSVVLSVCWVALWPRSVQIRQSGVEEEDLPLPDGKG